MTSTGIRKGAAILVILLFFALALDSLVLDSPTMDEENHLARGLAYLRTGDPRLSVEHPPLVNTLSALPLFLMPEIELPLEHPSWDRQPPDVFWYSFAEELVWRVNRDVNIQAMFFLARLPVVYLTIALGLTGWHFAREMWGKWSGVVAFILILLDPNILANGRYVTTDLGATLFAFLATYLLWRLWQGPGWNWRRWIWAALVIGLAFSSKLSTLAFLLIWVVLALIPSEINQERGYWRAVQQRIFQLSLAGIFAVFVVWMVYSFEWGNFLFLSDSLANLNRFQGPFPTFLAGIERILLLSAGGRPGFLLGEFSNTGFPLYFPIVFLIKTPVIVLILGVFSLITLLTLGSTRWAALFLFVPVAIFFMIVSQSALNLGYRHLLPVLPFLYMLVSGLMSQQLRSWIRKKETFAGDSQRIVRKLPVALAVVAICCMLLIDIWVHPHYLSYFNILVGGPENGYRVVVDSNIDWGQDLIRLKNWMVANDVPRIKLAWFGTADPAYYGIDYEPLPGFPRKPFYTQWSDPPFNVTDPEPGTYAISVSNLQELPLAKKNVYPWFRSREPDARVGYSILIFNVQ